MQYAIQTSYLQAQTELPNCIYLCTHLQAAFFSETQDELQLWKLFNYWLEFTKEYTVPVKGVHVTEWIVLFCPLSTVVSLIFYRKEDSLHIIMGTMITSSIECVWNIHNIYFNTNTTNIHINQVQRTLHWADTICNIYAAESQLE